MLLWNDLVMPDQTKILALGDTVSLSFECGDLPADEAVVAAGHVPNGYFWQGLIQYLAPDLSARVDLDPEGGMFAAYGGRSDLIAMQEIFDGYLDDAARVATTIREAESTGFQFDD